MKAVLDTNVLISGVTPTGVSHTVLVRGFENDYELLISQPIIQEFRDTLLKYPDKFRLTREEVATEVETIGYFGTSSCRTKRLRRLRTIPPTT